MTSVFWVDTIGVGKVNSETQLKWSIGLATRNQLNFVKEVLSDWFGGLENVPNSIERSTLVEIVDSYDNVKFPAWITQNSERRLGRGVYNIGDVVTEARGQTVVTSPSTPKKTPSVSKNSPEMVVETTGHACGPVASVADLQRVKVADSSAAPGAYIPSRNKNYLEYGNFSFILQIIRSGEFFPVWVSGLSGGGKTMGIEQACAKLKREFVRVNITGETDEDTLLGGFRLLNGETVFQKGPVVEAMERGAILCLDEIDLGIPSRIMCLQPILEGNGVYLSKIGEYVKPQPGFQIFATANTKGRGSDMGSFIGTNVLNAAMMDRFCSGIVQDYPPTKQEINILQLYMKNNDIEIESPYVSALVEWANSSRKTYMDGASDEIITTRRLINLLRLFKILRKNSRKNTRKVLLDATKHIVANFPEESQSGFYKSLTVMMPDDANSQTGDDSDTSNNDKDPLDDFPF